MTPPTTLPTAYRLTEIARTTLDRCGVDVDALAGDVTTRSPINGEPVFSVAHGDEVTAYRPAPGTGVVTVVSRPQKVLEGGAHGCPKSQSPSGASSAACDAARATVTPPARPFGEPSRHGPGCA